MSDRLKKHLFWFSLLMTIVSVVGMFVFAYLIQLVGLAPEYVFAMVLLAYAFYLALVAYRYRGKIDQGLELSALPFQIYFWLRIADLVFSLVLGALVGRLSVSGIGIAMAFWAYQIIKLIKAYNEELTLTQPSEQADVMSEQ